MNLHQLLIAITRAVVVLQRNRFGAVCVVLIVLASAAGDLAPTLVSAII